MKPRVAVLLSGGVDSSVALYRLLAAGHEVRAVYLKIWLEDELAHLGECPWEDDLRDARAVCERAGVVLDVVALQREYQQRVVAESLEELRRGRTPSPDVLCNRTIKFDAALDAVRDLLAPGEVRLASGHYARIARDLESATPHLLRGIDPVKDQTYFLHRLTRDQLAVLDFPLGGSTKAEVRAEATRLGLPNRDRPDSQGICFLGRIPFSAFVREHLGERPGVVRDVATGRVLGEHRGHWFHTVGQRRGLGLAGGPWYVVRKDVERDEILVAHGERTAERGRDRFEIEEAHWIAGAPPASDSSLHVRIRHGPRLCPAEVEVCASDATRALIRLRQPEDGVAPGQAAVVYAGQECLGGGWIRSPT